MSNPICEVKNLNLVYKNSVYKAQNLRNAFITFINDPINYLIKEPDRVHILKNITFDVYEGDRIGVLGVNGAGKTTLLRIISGVMKPTQGLVKVDPDTRAVFQHQLVLFPELTGYENAQLILGLMYPHLNNEECDKLTDEACAFSELGAALYTPYRTYSTGMQTRLLLSVATVRSARLLILDEVFDGADAFWQKKIATRTQNLIEKSGGLLFVSHNIELMASLCKSALVLKNGKATFFRNFAEGRTFYESQ